MEHFLSARPAPSVVPTILSLSLIHPGRPANGVSVRRRLADSLQMDEQRTISASFSTGGNLGSAVGISNWPTPVKHVKNQAPEIKVRPWHTKHACSLHSALRSPISLFIHKLLQNFTFPGETNNKSSHLVHFKEFFFFPFFFLITKINASLPGPPKNILSELQQIYY